MNLTVVILIESGHLEGRDHTPPWVGYVGESPPTDVTSGHSFSFMSDIDYLTTGYRRDGVCPSSLHFVFLLSTSV